MTCRDNILIFEDTKKQTREKYPVNFEDVRYYNGLSARVENVLNTLTPIEMVRGGTVSVGYKEAENQRVAILNFADALVAGGLVEIGAFTQEENICRCSNLYAVLSCNKSTLEYYQPNADSTMKFGRDVYTDRIIYARDITVFKDDTDYKNISPRKLDVITCPAPFTKLDKAEALYIYGTRIEQIVLSAIENDAECIVLGAWGCGAFGQSPEIVSRAFAHVLNKYGGYFKKIIFAIKPTSNTKETDNYKVFKDVLGKHYIGGMTNEE